MRPRPAILFTAAYWAGLATGLLRFGAPAGVAVIAMALGFVLAPAFASTLGRDFDLLATGLIGGTAAYCVGRATRR